MEELCDDMNDFILLALYEVILISSFSFVAQGPFICLFIISSDIKQDSADDQINKRVETT
jgi:hypothetical protein